MHTLIVTDDLRESNFVANGFYYEDLSTDVVLFSENNKKELIDRFFSYSCIVFFIKKDFPFDFVKELKKINNNFFIFVLVKNNLGELDKFTKINLFENIFSYPFDFRSIVSEIKFSVFTFNQKLQMKKYVLRDLELDVGLRKVVYKNKSLNLRNKEFALLQYLIINAGYVISRSSILEHVWDHNINILTNTVDVHISNLRKKLYALTKEKYIKTIPCLGYVME